MPTYRTGASVYAIQQVGYGDTGAATNTASFVNGANFGVPHTRENPYARMMVLQTRGWRDKIIIGEQDVVVEGGAQSITDVGAIASITAFGSAQLNISISGVGAIASGESVGSIVNLHRTLPIGSNSIASNEAIGATNNIHRTLPINNSIASLESFSDSQLNRNMLDVGGISTVESFGTSTLNITPPGQSLFVASVSTLEAFGSPQLNFAITPSSLVTLESFGNAQLNRTLPLSSITSLESFGIASLSGGDDPPPPEYNHNMTRRWSWGGSGSGIGRR